MTFKAVYAVDRNNTRRSPHSYKMQISNDLLQN